MKKVLNAILVFALLLTMVTPAFAAAPSDVVGTKYEDAATTLNATGVLTGYADGTFGLEDNITRAQFAAVAVRLLGLEDAAKVSGGATSFADGVPAWAQGYVNVASQQEIINGYADGRFGAMDNVTQSQAIAMLVRVLGYEPVVSENGWPTNYLVKASQIGLTSGLTVDPYQPATRGFVALLADNALYIDKMVETGVTAGSTNYAVASGNTLLTNNLGYTQTTGDVIASGALLGSTVEDNEFKIGTATFTFDDLTGLYGKNVTVFANSDNEVVKAVVNDEVLEAKVTANAADLATVTFDGDTDPTTVNSADYVLDYAVGTLTGTSADALAGLTVKYVLNDAGEIVYLEAVDYSSVTPIIVDSVDEEVVADKLGNDLTLTDKNYNLDLGDLNEFDVVYAFNTGNDYQLDVVSDVVAGDFTVKYSDGDYKIGGTRYDVNSPSFSLDNGATVGGTYADFIGETVSALLDVDGKVIYMFAPIAEEAQPTNHMVVTNYTSNTSGLDLTTSYYVKAIGQDNEEAWYELTDDTVFYDINGTADATVAIDSVNTIESFFGEATPDGSLDAIYLADVQLADDGTVASVSLELGTKTSPDTLTATTDFIVDRNLVKVGSAWVPVASNAVFFDELTSQEFLTWADVAGTGNDLTVDVYVVDGEVVAVYVTGGVITTSDSIEGIVAEVYDNADGDTLLALNQEGVVTEYVVNMTGVDAAALNGNLNDYVTLTLTGGEVTNYNVDIDVSAAGTQTVKSVGTLSITNDSDVVFYVDEDALYYDVTGEPAFITLSDLAADDTVSLTDVDADGLYDIVIVK